MNCSRWPASGQKKGAGLSMAVAPVEPGKKKGAGHWPGRPQRNCYIIIRALLYQARPLSKKKGGYPLQVAPNFANSPSKIYMGIISGPAPGQKKGAGAMAVAPALDKFCVLWPPPSDWGRPL